MQKEMLRLERMKKQIFLLFAVALLMAVLYVFFRYSHPIVIWDGDDWHTNCLDTNYIFLNVLDWQVGTLLNSNVLSTVLGGLFGHVAGVCIYPQTGDYIGAYMTADAIARALFITLSLFIMWRQLAALFSSSRFASAGIAIFLVSAFVLMKTSSKGQYLYWSYNRCAIYSVCIPSYLGGAFSLYLIRRYTAGDHIKLEYRSALLLAELYFLIFSFLPVAVLVVGTSFALLVFDAIKCRSLKRSLFTNWFHGVSMILFVVKAVLELLSTFSSGYLRSAGTAATLQASVQVMLSSFSQMHSLFKLMALIGIFFALDSMIIEYCKEKSLGKDSVAWVRMMAVLIVVFIIVFVFYTLYGAISLSHLSYNGVIRSDTMYCLYYVFIIMTVVSWLLVIQKMRKIAIVLPLILMMMSAVVISPILSFRDSIYSDSTAGQKYEVMSATVEAAQEKDKAGENSLIVHMPPYAHWDAGRIGQILQWHGVTDKVLNIMFCYDASPGNIWFE